jgi:DNA-directed RNA polymerase subunit RPC12/RpoP
LSLLHSKIPILEDFNLSLIATCRCGAKFQAPPNLAGKQVACPTCGQALVVPAAAPAPAQATGKIAVACQCGKRFAAPPNLAGRQVQCPACKQALVVPAGATRPAAQAPVAATGPISVSCRCGKSFAAPPNLAGKQVACPSCRNPIQVPHPGAPVAPSSANADGFWNEIKSKEKTPQQIYDEEQAEPEPFSPTQATSFAINQISKGVSAGVVYDELREKGVGPEESERIVEDLQDGKKRRIRGTAPKHNSKVGMAFWGLSVPGWLSILIAIGLVVLIFAREHEKEQVIGLIVGISITSFIGIIGIGSVTTSMLLKKRFKPARYAGFFFAVMWLCGGPLHLACAIAALISLSSSDMTKYLNEQ